MEESFEDDVEGVLMDDRLGEEEYDEDVLNGEEGQLLEDELLAEDGAEEGEITAKEETQEEEEEEMYEPSEVQSLFLVAILLCICLLFSLFHRLFRF